MPGEGLWGTTERKNTLSHEVASRANRGRIYFFARGVRNLQSKHLLHFLLVLPPVFGRIVALTCFSVPLFPEAYIDSVISRFSIKLPEFNFEHIKKTEAYEEKPGSFFVGEVIFTNRSYRVWVVTFGIPYKGQIEFLRYVPRAGTRRSAPLFWIN